MNIQEALKETGKATGLQMPDDWYVALNDEETIGVLSLYDFKGYLVHNVPLRDILIDDWQPYHDKKEIRPEKAGELWEGNLGGIYVTFRGPSGDLFLRGAIGGEKTSVDFFPDYSRWTRLYPPAEDENVEKVVIKGVHWATAMNINGNTVAPIADTSKYFQSPFKHLVGKPSMTMTLEWKKEDS